MISARGRTLSRLVTQGLLLGVTLVMLLASHAAPVQATMPPPAGGPSTAFPSTVVVEHLRVKVPAEARQAWIEAEQGSWGPWLEHQRGFLDRQLLWDPAREEGTLLIRWADRDSWKGIPRAEVAAVQARFEQLARRATGRHEGQDNPFPLVFEGELLMP